MGSYWDRYLRARISRRRMLRAAGVTTAAAGAVALVGCGDSHSGEQAGEGNPTAESRPDQPDIINPQNPPQRGGTLVTANSAPFGTFDPHVGVAVASAYFPRVYNTLVNQSATKPEFFFFDLAESYETPDDTTYVFKIRPGVRIAPNDMGVPERDLDGEDVKVTLERIKTDPSTTNYNFASKYIESVTVQGDTVTIKTPEPYAWFISRVGHFFNCIVPRELLSGDLSRLASQAAGAGAFRLVSVAENDTARFAANPNYYGKDSANGNEQLPYVDGLEVRVIFERATQRTAFESGQIQHYWAASGEEARGFGNDVGLSRDPNFAFISFTMNPEKKPFDDPRVRRAIARAINREDFIRVVYQGDAGDNGIVHWPLGSYAFGADELRNTYQPFDLEEAKRLVQEAGGIRFKMMYPANTTIEEHGLHLPVFIEQMKAAGIEVDEDPQEFTTWIANYQGVNYDSSLALNQTYETPELPLAFHTGGGPFGDKSYIQGLGDPAIDEAVLKANRALDLEARIAAVHDAQQVIYENDPMFLPLVSPYQHHVWSNKVRNIPTGVGTTTYFLHTYWMES